MERSPALAARGHGARGLRDRRDARASSSCARSTRARRPALEAAIAQARADGLLGDGHPRQRLRLRRARRRRRRLVRRRRGDGAARLPARACAAPSRRGRRSRPSAASTAARPSSTTSRRSRTSPFIAARGAEAYRDLSPAARTPGTKLVCFNERFARPGVVRGAVRDAGRASSARTSPAASWTGARSRRCRSAARSAGSCPASLLDTPFDFAPLAEPTAAWSATARSSPSTTDRHARARRATCSRSARTRAAARASRAGSASQRAHEDVRRRAPPSIARGSRRCWRRSRSRASARTAAGCRRRSAASSRTSRTSWGCADARHDRRRAGRGRSPATTVLDAARAGRRGRPDALLRRAPGAVRRLPRLPGRASRGRTGADVVASCTTPCREGMVVARRATRAPAASSARVVELVLSELPAPPAPHTELAAVARDLGVGEPRWSGRGPRARRRHAPSLPRLPARALHLAAGAACARATRSRARSR